MALLENEPLSLWNELGAEMVLKMSSVGGWDDDPKPDGQKLWKDDYIDDKGKPTGLGPITTINFGKMGVTPLPSTKTRKPIKKWSTSFSVWNVHDEENHYYGTISVNCGPEGKDPWQLANYTPANDTRYSLVFDVNKKILPHHPSTSDQYDLKCEKVIRPDPPIISNKEWESGLKNPDSDKAASGEEFWVADYGADKWSPVTKGKRDGIQQSTTVPNPGSRAYPIRFVTGAPEWQVCKGNEPNLPTGVAHDGLWQIAIKIGSNGRPVYEDRDGKHGWCETFYLAERFPSLFAPNDLHWGPNYYSDGQGGLGGKDKEAQEKELSTKKVKVWKDQNPNEYGKLVGGRGAYSREIDIMETMWTADGPQLNLGNRGGGTGWNTDELAGKANYGLDTCIDKGGNSVTRKPLWEDVHPHTKFDKEHPSKEPLTTDFIIFGCLIRPLATGKRLWLYAYKGPSDGGEQWYCTGPISQINKDYKQEHPFVTYIGTWNNEEKPTDGKWATQYNRFIYLKEDHHLIAGKNPKDQPEAFGLALIPDSWQQIAGWLSHISVGADGTVCGVNEKEGKLYRFVGGTAGSGWDSGPKAVAPAGVVPVPSGLSVVSVGGATNIWIQDKAGNTYRYVENAWGQGVGGWSPVTSISHGGEQSICAASDGTVCGLSPNGRVLKWAFIGGWTYQEPFGAKELKVVAVGSKDHIWGVDKDDLIHRWDVKKNKWEPIPGDLSTISVAADGAVWGVNKNGDIYSYIDDKKGWLHRPGKLKVIAVGSKEHIWGLDEHGVIKRYIPPYTA